MIPSREIKEKARQCMVPPSTIERDYAQNWVLAYLSALPLALKGGTGIRKVYFEQYRFSDDLDFTLLETYEKETLFEAVEDAVSRAREESGIRFEEDTNIIRTVTGFRVTVKFRILSGGTTSPIKIDLDLTTSENEEMLLPVQRKPIFHPYSDGLKASVTSYSLEEIMAEKIRSLFQRIRPRDIYDIWQLADHVNPEDVGAILRRKCEPKEVVPDPRALLERADQFSAAWENSLRHQMKTVPDFTAAFETALAKTKQYSRTGGHIEEV